MTAQAPEMAAAGLLIGKAMPKARIVEAEGFHLKDGPRLALADENC